MTLCSAILHIYCYILSGQGAIPKSLAGRIVFLTSYVVSMVILVAYSAALISFLTIQRTVLPFETLEELLHDGTYNLQVLAGAELSYFHVSYKYYHSIHSLLFLRAFSNSKSYAKIM
jgi:hypothetical protein